MTRRGLQVMLAVLGTVAFVFGALAVIFGAGLVPDAGRVSANIDSEMRFFAAWYAAAGLLILRTVPRVESEGITVRAIGAVFFIAGCARLVSTVVVGRPHTFFLALMVAELAIPALVVPWQASVARQTN